VDLDGHGIELECAKPGESLIGERDVLGWVFLSTSEQEK
jgi:hypothetical protein